MTNNPADMAVASEDSDMAMAGDDDMAQALTADMALGPDLDSREIDTTQFRSQRVAEPSASMPGFNLCVTGPAAHERLAQRLYHLLQPEGE